MTVVVVIHGEALEISVRRRSMVLWVARGTYKGQSIQTSDATYGTAVKRWREAALAQGS